MHKLELLLITKSNIFALDKMNDQNHQHFELF